MEEESQNAKDVRVEKLWKSLHNGPIEPLDLDGLRAGLKKIGHPLGTAEKLLKQVFEVVDTSKDGKIEYSEFRAFIEHTEAELRSLFNSIDKDHNGCLDRAELHAAFKNADITANVSKLDKFFDHIDINHDGQITFEEWRNFLMFVPLDAPDLGEVLSYYNTYLFIGSEGDVSVHANAGLGTNTILYLFRVIFDLTKFRPVSYQLPPLRLSSLYKLGTSPSDRRDIPWDPGELLVTDRKMSQYPESEKQSSNSSVANATAPSNSVSELAQSNSQVHRTAGSVASNSNASSSKTSLPGLIASKFQISGVEKPLSITSASNSPASKASASDTTASNVPVSSSSTLTSSAITSSPQKSATNVLTDLLPHPGYFLAGGVAGFMSRTATAPLDRLKVYLIAQVGRKGEATNALKSGSPLKAMRAASGPLANACVELWKMGGIRSLFAGNGLNVLKVMPESAIKFGSYEAAKRLAARIEGHDNTRGLSAVSQFMAAGAGGVISQFAVYPLDTLKFRVQCETVAGGPQGNTLIIQTAKKMIAEGSMRSYYRGLLLGLGGMFPYSAIDLTTYEYLRKRVTAYNMSKRKCSEKAGEPGRMMTGAIGAISSSFGATAVYPVNLIRTRIQSQGTAIHPPTYKGWRDCFNQTIKGEGYKGLYKGLTPNLLKVVPSMSISYMVYETSKKVMGLR